MIRLGLRLAVAGGREAIIRLVSIAAAVAIGVGLLLATISGINAVHAQNDRYAWLNSGSTSVRDTAGGTGDPLWWSVNGDYFDAQEIGRIDVAATGPGSPVPPGIPRLPGPGEYYSSPALHDLLTTTPAAQLGDRYPGHEIGTIGDEALPSPDSLLIVIGHTPDEASHLPGAQQITGIGTISPGNCADCIIGIRAAGFDLILGVVAGALLFPVLIFIGTATRLSATRREQRFAAMRLIGATPRQVSIISTVESTAASVVGTLAGFGVFAAIRGPLSALPFTGLRFFPADLSLTLANGLLVAVGVPVAAAVAARLALRRVTISPLGVTRRVTPRPPRAWRLIPLLAGLMELAYFVGAGRRPATSTGQVAAFLPGFLIIMAGLVIAGPWFTMVASRALARRAQRPATLIAARRLADSPQTAFRAVSGLVLGLFVTSVAIGVITTIAADRGGHHRADSGTTTLARQFWAPDGDPGPDSLSPEVTADLRATAGVRGVILVRANPRDDNRDGFRYGPMPGLVTCADLASFPALGSCADGATVASVWSDFSGPDGNGGSGTTWPTADITIDELHKLTADSITVITDGSATAIESARTTLELAYPGIRPPLTEADFAADVTRVYNGWVQLANVVILASLPIAGCSLAVSVAGGLSDRKRPFSLLRLSGVPLRELRRVVALESAVPLLLVALVAIGVGLLSAQLFLTAQMHLTLVPPGASYYAIVVAGLAVSLGIIGSTLPMLRRITGPETARNE
jgi:hypothetical protein